MVAENSIFVTMALNPSKISCVKHQFANISKEKALS